MQNSIDVEKCFSFINLNLQPTPGAGRRIYPPQRWRAVTISRQAGSGGHAVAEHLAKVLEAEATGTPWAVFDRNIVEKVLEEHHLPKRVGEFMTEDRISEINDTLDELFGLHPPTWTLVRNTADTILHLVKLGNVIIIGRAAHVITRKFTDVFRVRLVGSIEKRAKYVADNEKLSLREARTLVQRLDRGRARYVRKYFEESVDDPLLYHLTINTDGFEKEQVARIILTSMAEKKVAA